MCLSAFFPGNSVLHKQSLWSLCTNRCSAFKESHCLLDPLHLKHMPTACQETKGWWWLQCALLGPMFSPKLPELFLPAPGPCILNDAGCLTQGMLMALLIKTLPELPEHTLHALISAVPCLRSSLYNMLLHPQHWLLSQQIRKHCPLCVQLPKRSFHSRQIAQWQFVLVFPFLSSATSCSKMNHWNPVIESVRLWNYCWGFSPKVPLVPPWNLSSFLHLQSCSPFSVCNWYISFWRNQNSELISRSFIGMLC